jgi:outer membrane receptor protein involved in Fe transport
MTINRTANFMNALQGKMAGVNITSLGSGPAGTSKIRIRGQSSFGGNNSPLIVVNGVPIDNTNNGARGDVSEKGSNRTSDGGDGLSSINPDDIEAMTVLKGAAASALVRLAGQRRGYHDYYQKPGNRLGDFTEL